MNQPLSFELRIGVSYRGPMHAQALGELAARLQPLANPDGAGHDPLADLIANLHVERFVQARIERQEHSAVLLVWFTSPIYFKSGRM